MVHIEGINSTSIHDMDITWWYTMSMLPSRTYWCMWNGLVAKDVLGKIVCLVGLGLEPFF